MTRRRVVVTDYTFPDLDRERRAAEAAGAGFEAFRCRTAEEVAEAIRGAAVAVVQFAPVNAAAIAGMAADGALIRYGIGFDNIDVAAANAWGLPVGYVPDYCIDEVAEHSVAAVLAMLRKLPRLDHSVRAGEWAAVAAARPLKRFAETTVGFFGYGQIGRAVHARLKPLGFRFLVADPALSAAEAADLGASLVPADEVFRTADVISLHAPANDHTRHFVDAGRLATMQPHAVLVNSARGALIDEAAVAAALTEGRIGGAALDVFEVEPLPEGSPLRGVTGGKLLLTPHAAWYSETAIERLQQLVADDVSNHLAGRALRKPVPGSRPAGRG